VTQPMPVNERQGSAESFAEEAQIWSRQSAWNESVNPHSSSPASPLPGLLSSNSARSFVPVAPPVHRLNVVGMVISLGSPKRVRSHRNTVSSQRTGGRLGEGSVSNHYQALRGTGHSHVKHLLRFQ
jgi:hypothetical protein